MTLSQSRKPLYHKDGEQFRVIYVPGGYYVAQKRVAPKGTKTFDPWENLHPLTQSRDIATQIMYERKPARPS